MVPKLQELIFRVTEEVFLLVDCILPSFLLSTKSRAEMNYHIAKEQSKGTAKFIRKCKIFDTNIHSFYLLPEHKQKKHGAQRSSGAQIVDVTQLMANFDDKPLKEELETCKDFWWTVG